MPPLPARQGRSLEPPRKAPARDADSPQELSAAPSPRPSEARRVAPRAHPRGPQGAGEGRLRPRWLLFHPHRAWLEAWAKGSCPGKSCSTPSAQAPSWLPLRRQQQYLQPSDPGRERLGKVLQPLATAVQQVPEAAAGSGARALGGDPAAAALDRARASQHRAQQQPHRRRGRAEPRRAHRGPAASRSALRSAAGAHSEPGTYVQPRGCPRSGPRVRAQVNSFLSLPTAKPFHAREQREGNRQERLTAQSCSASSVGAPKPLLPAKETFSPPPGRGAPSPARRAGGRGVPWPARAHWPARPPSHAAT